jgi:hypothetical protein
MRSFKEQGFNERLQLAAKAKQALLDKYKSRPGESDPEILKLREQQKAIAEARAAREAEKAEKRRQEAEAKAARETAEKAERERLAKRAAIEAVIRGETLAAQQKAKRDARYAARKARKSGG